MLTVGQMSRITKEVVLKMPPTLTTWEALQFRAETECEIEEMRRDGIAPDLPYDFDDDDRQEESSHREPDGSRPVMVEGHPTLAKILPELTVEERMWLASMVQAYGETQVLSLWPSYEVQINFARGISSADSPRQEQMS